MKLLSTFVLATTLAFSSVALANETGKESAPHHGGKGHHGAGFFKKVDTNGDGVISKEEHQAHSDKMFDRLDTNHDGEVTKEEAKAGRAKMHAKFKERQTEQGTHAVIKKGDSEPKTK